MPDYTYERELGEKGFGSVAGVDEAGRGPLAGPVCAAAVILPDGLEIPGLDDSKKISAKKRDALFDLIKEKAAAYGIAFASETEIDELNILNATFLAMKRAVSQLGEEPSALIIDGNRAPGTGLPEFTLVKGDSKSMSVAAASILAKVTRDRLMDELDAKYPGYGFAVHKGYPTKAHYEAIGRLGASPVHRMSFLKTLDKHI